MDDERGSVNRMAIPANIKFISISAIIEDDV